MAGVLELTKVEMAAVCCRLRAGVCATVTLRSGTGTATLRGLSWDSRSSQGRSRWKSFVRTWLMALPFGLPGEAPMVANRSVICCKAAL
jgi:hypothetical protein